MKKARGHSRCAFFMQFYGGKKQHPLFRQAKNFLEVFRFFASVS